MARRSIRIGPFTLGAGGKYQSLNDPIAFAVEDNGSLSVHCVIDGGTDGAPPVDSPVGAWQLYFAGDERAPYIRCTAAESGKLSLADIAPNGNTYVNAFANFTNIPLARCKLVYSRTSGGTSARATLYITVS